jgi:hypothetical protein
MTSSLVCSAASRMPHGSIILRRPLSILYVYDRLIDRKVWKGRPRPKKPKCVRLFHDFLSRSARRWMNGAVDRICSIAQGSSLQIFESQIVCCVILGGTITERDRMNWPQIRYRNCTSRASVDRSALSNAPNKSSI